MKYIYVSLISLFMLGSCSGPGKGLFSSKIPHEIYGNKITQAGLHTTRLGAAWFEAAERGLAYPSKVTIPYSENGYFSAEEARSAGFVFNGKRGEKVEVNVLAKPDTGFHLFLELWRLPEGGRPALMVAADTSLRISEELPEEGAYILRLQPELLAAGSYTVTINTAPSLAFPVPKSANPRVASFWGADRDGGARRHEGVDIFAAKRTPLLAAADGYITSVRENKLGGKTVFLRPEGKNYSLYYAHLDEQLVRQGQRVNLGDTVGLMGNTGNARTTPPHLHLGIYTNGGAIDPFPFVNMDRPEPPSIGNPAHAPKDSVRTTGNSILYDVPGKGQESIRKLPSNTLLKIESQTAAYYRVRLPDGVIGYIRTSQVKGVHQPLRNTTVKNETAVYAQPEEASPMKSLLQEGEQVKVLAVYDKFSLVQARELAGWIIL